MEYRPVPKPSHKRRGQTRKERGRITKREYEAVWERDEGCCVLCGRNAASAYSLDCHHVIFRSQGGAGKRENLVLLCGPVTQSGTCHFKAHSVQAKAIREKLLAYIRRHT